MSGALPHSLDAERAVLCAVLIDGQAIGAASETITPADFYSKANGLIFGAALALSERAEAIDVTTLGDALGRDLEQAGGLEYLSGLVTGMPRVPNVGNYANIVKKKATLRAMIKTSGETIKAAMVRGADADEIFQAAHESLTKIASGNGRKATRGLEFLGVSELVAKVSEAGQQRYLLRGICRAGDYFVHGAEYKAQKTWFATDLAVSVASKTPFLGHVPVDDPGPVLFFFGEGGEANVVRRLRAIAEGRGVVLEDLPITVCTRSPHLGNPAHMQTIADQIEQLRPSLVILDPLYLAASGANLANLYEMGALLEEIQLLCQSSGAALLVVTHFNRKQGRGAGRIVGAGPAEWGRVLITANVVARRTDPSTGGSSVITELDIIGGEVPDQRLRVHRRIWSDDPNDLNAPLHVETTVTEATISEHEDGESTALAPAARKLLEALEAADDPSTAHSLVDRIAERHGHGLKRETVSRNLNDLERRGLVASLPGTGFKSKLWVLAEQGENQ